MFKNRKYITLLLLTPITLFSNCDEDKEKKYSVCDCTGTGLQEFEGEEGVMALTLDGYRVISGNRCYVTDCEDFPVSLRKHGQLVKITGWNVESCNFIEHNYSRYINKAELTSIEPIENINRIGRVKVEIFYSTNDGGVSGWGYLLQDTVRDFNIRQNDIPGKPGWEQFKTPEEAWVVAVLIAYKMNYSSDFPDFGPDSAYLGY